MDTTSNPFADPHAAASPFNDPSVQQHTSSQANAQKVIEDYNPFSDEQNQRAVKARGAANGPGGSATGPGQQQGSQPAVMQATQEPPPPYTSGQAAKQTQPQQQPQPAGLEELQRKQEEIERKEAEIRRREEQLRQVPYNARQNNWPPLPAMCPVKPCFYQDFTVDIPLEFQKIVKTLYYLWLFYSATLILNLLGTLAYFVTGGNGATFGMGLVYLILFIPLSFICWFRPVYKAFRSDSSFNFFLYFFVFFFQFVVNIVQAIGIDDFGTCGFINGLEAMNTRSSKVQGYTVGGIMLIIGFFFAMNAVVGFLCLMKVHRIYRSTGASFEKAQQEFATGIMTNPNVQSAAANAASGAARSAATGAMGGTRY